MEEGKLVVTEKTAFVDRDKPLLIEILECSDSQNFDARIKINDSLTNCPSKCVKFSLETSMIKMMAVVTEKIEFECMDKSLLKALSRFFGLSGF